MAYIVMAYIVMAYIVTAYTVMAYTVVAFLVMVYTQVRKQLAPFPSHTSARAASSRCQRTCRSLG